MNTDTETESQWRVDAKPDWYPEWGIYGGLDTKEGSEATMAEGQRKHPKWEFRVVPQGSGWE